jgi:predicted MFS family arabinose efflux permease
MTTAQTRNRLAVVILATGCFTTGLNVGVLSPLITSIGRDFTAADAAVGQAVALHAAIAGLTALLVAPWIDRFPRRMVLRVECLFLLAATALSALAPNVTWLFIGRGLAGIGGAVVGATCLAATGDLFANAQQRNRAIGLISAAFSVSTIAGLTLITQIADLAGWRLALGSLLLPTLLVLLGTAWLPATAERASAADAGGYRRVLAHGQVNWLLLAVITFCIVWAGWTVFFGAFTEADFAISAAGLSLLFMIGGVAQLLASSLLPVLLRRRSARTTVVCFALLVSGSLLTVGLVSGAWWPLIPFVVLLSFGAVTLYLTLTVLLLDALPTARGAVMALQTGCFEIGWAAGAALTGVALTTLGSYARTHQLLALLVPLSVACVLLSARRARPAAARQLAGPSDAEQRVQVGAAS